MGGDHGPHVTVPAALAFQARHPGVDIVLVGLPSALQRELKLRSAAPGARLRVHAASEVVGMDEAPAQAMRYKKDSSMRVAVNLVKGGQAHACVSAGNTGALMAISRSCLRRFRESIGRDCHRCCRTDKAAIPCARYGPNVDCTAEQMMQFGVMGAMLVAAVEHRERPSVGL